MKTRTVTRMRRIVSVALALLPAVVAWPQSADYAEARRQINEAAAKTNTMVCDFVQTKQLKMLNDKMVSRGKMYYKQSDKLRWEYTTPYTYTFILNGQKVLIKKGGREDVIDAARSGFFKEITRVMMNSVVGKCLSDEKDFKVSMSATDTQWVAELVPQRKDMKKWFSTIVLHFDKKKSTVTSVELIEPSGDRTLIELKNVEVNKTVNEAMFSVD